MTRDQIEQQVRKDNPTTSLDGLTRIGAGHPDYEALIEAWTDAAVASLAEQSTAAALIDLAAALLAIFASMTPSQRGRVYPARAGLKMALEEGDIEAGRAVIESIDALDEDEQAIKDSMLALFPA
jgi:hypothetical protein